VFLQDGHYVFVVGENLTRRYKILSKLGEGTFGKVVECWDRIRKEYCAVKIIRNVPKYRRAAFLEVTTATTVPRHPSTPLSADKLTVPCTSSLNLLSFPC